VSNDISAGAFSDNAEVPYEGIKATALTSDQLDKLWALVELYVGNMDDGHAAIKMAEVKKYVADTHFSWHGSTDTIAPIYYRVQSPVILIELDCPDLGPIGQGAGWPTGPSQHHVHTIVRTPNGGDYGKDLLALHLALDH